MNLILGGPSYRMEVDARHAARLVEFALVATHHRTADGKGVAIIGTAYEHGTPVALARNHLFKGALGVEDADVLLWLDSDCAFASDQIPNVLRALHNWSRLPTGAPMLIIPAPQRDRQLNIWKSKREKLTRLSTDGALHPCYAGGFGCVAFDLAWYRAAWPEGPWFRDGWEGEAGYLSEDFNHCRLLADRGCQPMYAATYVDHHARGKGEEL